MEERIAGAWWAATADAFADVAGAAVRAWKAAFPRNNGVVGAARNRPAVVAFAADVLAASDFGCEGARPRALGGLGKLVDAARSTGVDDAFLSLITDAAAAPSTWKALRDLDTSDALERRAARATRAERRDSVALPSAGGTWRRSPGRRVAATPPAGTWKIPWRDEEPPRPPGRATGALPSGTVSCDL